MIFGDINIVAIEVGELIHRELGNAIQFRFHIFKHRIGDWNDRIPLALSAEYMQTFLACAEFRRGESFKNVNASDLFRETYDAFYEYDYSRQPILRPNLRDRYQLSEVGVGATRDKYGIVVVEVAPETSRIVVKNLSTGRLFIDKEIPTFAVEQMGKDFVDWAQNQQSNV